jgi:O-methyltransferase involved in polyketide biosynthesis
VQDSQCGDLADPAARDAFLNEELAGATKALVLTEGLLMYLEDSDVRALSTAFTRPEVAWWMLDFSGPGLQRRMNKRSRGMMDSAPFKFAPANGLAYFEDLGWRAVEMDSVFSAAHRFDRLPGWMRPRGVATSARSAQSGQQYLQRGCPPYALRVTTSER